MPKKSKKEIASLEEAKIVMQFINDYDRLLAQHLEKESNVVAEARAKFHTGQRGADRDEWEQEKKIQVKRLENFAKKNRKEWKQKSIDTPFGTFGFRKGQPCVVLVKKISKNFEEVLEKVKKNLPGYVRIKKEINKDGLLEDFKSLNSETLNICGIKIDQKEPFFVKTLAAERLEQASKKLKSA